MSDGFFRPRTGQLINVRQDGDRFNFKSMCPPEWTPQQWFMVATLLIVHVARNAKVDPHAVLDDVIDMLDVVHDGEFMVEEREQ